MTEVALGEDCIVALLSKGDLVAIEAKYHRDCYTGFKRCYNAICKRDTASEDIEVTDRLIPGHTTQTASK